MVACVVEVDEAARRKVGEQLLFPPLGEIVLIKRGVIIPWKLLSGLEDLGFHSVLLVWIEGPDRLRNDPSGPSFVIFPEGFVLTELVSDRTQFKDSDHRKKTLLGYLDERNPLVIVLGLTSGVMVQFEGGGGGVQDSLSQANHTFALSDAKSENWG